MNRLDVVDAVTAPAPHVNETGLALTLAPRVAQISAGAPTLRRLIGRLIAVGLTGLPRMFQQAEDLFCFRRRRTNGKVVLEGLSLRYSAIVALGAMHLPPEIQRRICGGAMAIEYVERLSARIHQTDNLGDTALICWAAAAAGLTTVSRLTELLCARARQTPVHTTVETAWMLAALTAGRRLCAVGAFVSATRDELLAARSRTSGLFGHWTTPGAAPWYRAHVACFADQVYPIQALARCHQAFGHEESLDAAARCAGQLSRSQGPAGQWWWHYDVRTGHVIEGYPVYTVHQDSMAPMALLDLREAGGPDHTAAVQRGLEWLERPPETSLPLIDDELALIWRKVARNDPRKLVRSVRTLLSRLHPNARLAFLDRWFPARTIDYEDRPYHLGWILHTWLGHV